MRISKLSKVYLILLILTFSLITINSVFSDPPTENDAVLVTQILDMSFVSRIENTRFTEYIFEVTGEVWNKHDNSVSIEHPNGCAFGVYFNPVKIEGDALAFSSIACIDKITSITYSPGSTNYSTIGAIAVQSSNSTALPNGTYIITLGEPLNPVYQQKVTFMKTFMRVSNGEISFTYSAFDSELKLIPPEQTDYPVNENVISDSDNPEALIDINETNEQLIVLIEASEENEFVDEYIVNIDAFEVASKNLNFNTFLIWISMSFIIGMIRFLRSKYH